MYAHLQTPAVITAMEVAIAVPTILTLAPVRTAVEKKAYHRYPTTLLTPTHTPTHIIRMDMRIHIHAVREAIIVITAVRATLTCVLVHGWKEIYWKTGQRRVRKD